MNTDTASTLVTTPRTVERLVQGQATSDGAGVKLTRVLTQDQGEGVLARVIAGATHGVAGAMQREGTEPLYLDLHLAPGAAFEQPLPAAHNAFVYVYRGELAMAGTLVPGRRMAILANTPGSDGVTLQAGSDGARAIFIAGRPLNEPIAQVGPFVMNTQQEIFEAVQDFQAGRLG